MGKPVFWQQAGQGISHLVGQDYVKEIRTGGKGLSSEYREVISRAGLISLDKKIFHWDLEFPEAFIDLNRKDWKQKEEQGFDVVIGNPPYDVLSTEELGYDISQELEYFRANDICNPACKGKTNLYKVFVCKALWLAERRGMFSFITPMALLGDESAQEVRRLLFKNAELISIESFPQKDNPENRVFIEAKLSTQILVAKKTPTNGQFVIRVHPVSILVMDLKNY